jgi:hypothetical protein
VCRGWVGLRADICACGFDLGTRNVERAIEQARRDLRTGRLLQLAGLGGIAVCAALFLMPPGLSIGWTMRTWFLVRGLPVITAIYGLGRGIGLRRDRVITRTGVCLAEAAMAEAAMTVGFRVQWKRNRR